jgi:hypothetical protein
MTTGEPWRLTGTLRVALPPAEAFGLFTARGEERWVEGWAPRFPGPVDDDTAPGVVWETGSASGPPDHPDGAGPGEHTIWLVLDTEPGRRIRYARVTPHDRAGTVEVTLADAPDGGSDVTVTYVLTALTPAADEALAAFAADYDDFLAGWATLIERHLAS